jgi:hypothetical protein
MSLAAFGLVSAVAGNLAVAQGRTVFFTKHCGYSMFKLTEIGLTCANNAVLIETPSWEVWGEDEASTLGTLVSPAPSCKISICSKKLRHEVVVTLRRPVFCSSSGRWQFTRLHLDDLSGPLPEGIEESRAYRCSDFVHYIPPSPPSHHTSYWRHCAPVQGVVSGDMLAHRIGCHPARKVIKRVLEKGQEAQGPIVRAMGFVCALRVYSYRPVTCRRGGQRILSPLPG